MKAIYRVASMASFISFDREYNQWEARNPLHTCAGCNRAVFQEKIPAMLAASTFPAGKREGWIKHQAKLFTLSKFPDESL